MVKQIFEDEIHGKDLYKELEKVLSSSMTQNERKDLKRFLSDSMIPDKPPSPLEFQRGERKKYKLHEIQVTNIRGERRRYKLQYIPHIVVPHSPRANPGDVKCRSITAPTAPSEVLVGAYFIIYNESTMKKNVLAELDISRPQDEGALDDGITFAASDASAITQLNMKAYWVSGKY